MKKLPLRGSVFCKSLESSLGGCFYECKYSMMAS